MNILAQISSSVSGAESTVIQAQSNASTAASLWQTVTGWIEEVPAWVWWTLLGILLAGFLGWLAWRFFRWLRRKRRTRKLRRKLTGHVAPAEVPTDSGRLTGIRRRIRTEYRRARRTSRSLGRHRGEYPLYLLVGSAESGKQTLLESVGLRKRGEEGDPGGGSLLHFSFLEEATLLTVDPCLTDENSAEARLGWDELLRCLRKRKVLTAINGVLVVHSVDHLLLDSPEATEEAAQTLRARLNRARRKLKLSFGIYSIINKVDLLPGMAHLLRSSQVAENAGEMLGWANPSPPEEAFRTDLLREGLENLGASVSQAAHAAAQDEVNRHQSYAAPALERLPQALRELSERIVDLHSTIFFPSHTPGRPFFLRGVFFVSTTQDGQVLDIQLARALQADSVDPGNDRPIAEHVRRLAQRLSSLEKPETVAQPSSPFFLRDLFREKILREAGLVRSSRDLQRASRFRRSVTATLFVAGLAGALVWAGLEWLNRKSEILKENQLWRDAASRFYFPPGTHRLEWTPVTTPQQPAYFGNQALRVQGLDRPFTLDAYHGALARATVQMPPYRPFLDFTFLLETDSRRNAQRLVFDAGVLQPLVLTAGSQLLAGGPWSEQKTRALASLLRLKADLLRQREGERVEPPDTSWLEGLLAVIPGAPPAPPGILNAYEVAYGAEAARRSWPPRWAEEALLFPSTQPADETATLTRVLFNQGIREGLAEFLHRLEQDRKRAAETYAALKRMADQAENVLAAEAAFFNRSRAIAARPGDRDEVGKHLDRYRQAVFALEARVAAVEKAGLTPAGLETIQGMLRAEEERLRKAWLSPLQEMQQQLEPLVKRLNPPPSPSEREALRNSSGAAQPAFVRATLLRLEEERRALSDWIQTQGSRIRAYPVEELDRRLLFRPGLQSPPFYLLRLATVEEAVSLLHPFAHLPPAAPGHLTSQIRYLRNQVELARFGLWDRFGASQPNFRKATAAFLQQVGIARDRLLVDRYLAALSQDLSSRARFPLSFPPVQDPPTLRQLLANWAWILRVREDAESPLLQNAESRGVQRLRAFSRGLGLLEPMWAGLLRPAKNSRPPPGPVARYAAIVPSEDRTTASAPLLFQNKGYRLATGSLFLLSYERQVNLTRKAETGANPLPLTPPARPARQAEKSDGKSRQQWTEEIESFYAENSFLPDIYRSLRVDITGEAPLLVDPRQSKDLLLTEGIPLSVASVTFTLNETAVQTRQVQRYGEGWALLRFLMDAGVYEPHSQQWILPVAFEGPSGWERYLWFGLKLDSDFPPRSEWPRLAANEDQKPREAPTKPERPASSNAPKGISNEDSSAEGPGSGSGKPSGTHSSASPAGEDHSATPAKGGNEPTAAEKKSP
jgi:hypothetical protein